MPGKTIYKKEKLVRSKGLVLSACMLFFAPLLGHAANSTTNITMGEIALYVGLIVAVIGVAWVWAFKGKQTENQPPQQHGHAQGHGHHHHGKHHHGHGHGKHHRR
ncbi:MAG: hypothetical protein FD123_1200 [Bacteroidetes bacterium]|nr:MAG: hypothetical protein FD123_1200 [Bacteroidota bacterium]